MFKNLLAKIFGSYLERKAELYEGTPTEGKPWYKSKTILAGIVVMLRGLYEGASQIMVTAGHTALPPIPTAVDGILGTLLGMAAIKGRVDASEPITVGAGVSPTDQAPSK